MIAMTSQEELRRTSLFETLAILVVDALVDGGFVAKSEFDSAAMIAREEIGIRLGIEEAIGGLIFVQSPTEESSNR